MNLGGEARLVSEKFAVDPAIPAAVAVTVYGVLAGEIWLFAVAGKVATPLASVFTVGFVTVMLGPAAGAAKVTATPDTPFPELSVTVACRGAKARFLATA